MEKATKKNNYHYNPKLKNFARTNRKQMTKSAASMWKYILSRSQMLGYSFRRERPILNFIVDFVCIELMLVIEVDGWTHDGEENVDKDIERDRQLMEVGFEVLRFSSWEVLNRIDDVSIVIREWIEENHDKTR